MGGKCTKANDYDDDDNYGYQGVGRTFEPNYLEFQAQLGSPDYYDRSQYVVTAYPLEKDDEPIPPILYANPDRSPYVIDVSLSYAWGSFVPKNDHQDIPCALILNAPDLPLEQRLGVDIICIIDVSGSMQEDNKLLLVKKTLIFLIAQLSEVDRLCIISFSNNSKKLMPLTVMSMKGKSYAATVVQYLSPGGGTNLVEGLKYGLTVALMRNMINYSLDIMILSDGVDNNQDTALYRSRDCFNSFNQYNISYAIHAFGYGHEHDSELLGDVAHISNGGFYFVESPDDIRHSFAYCLGEILSVVARDLKVSLQVQPCQIPFSIGKVYSECTTSNFRMPNLASGSSKEAVFVLAFPPTRLQVADCTITPIKAQVSFVVASTGELVNVEKELSIDILNSSKNIQVFKGVMIHFLRVKGADALKQAGDLGAQGYYDDAVDVLHQAMQDLKKSEFHNEPIIKTLINDLERSKNKVKHSEAWKRGGHAHFRHLHHGHWAKRGEQNDQYMNLRQKDLRVKAQRYF